jgi:serine/threonine protein kinase
MASSETEAKGKVGKAVDDLAALTKARSVRGRRFGRYVLQEHLASGGMAEIFLARLPGEGGFAKDLVLKILQQRYLDNPQVVQMFTEEARLGAELRHPAIVDIYDNGEENGLRYIAMEYIEGRTLSEVVTRAFEVSHPLPISYAVYVLQQVAEGLAYLQEGLGIAPPGRTHWSGVVHRDISPPNLIVSYAGRTKIIDFGIARSGASVSVESGARPGKLSYMSPEQAQAHPLDGRSDIFSLGTILYEVTLGRRLWRGAPETVLRRIVHEDPEPPTFVNRGYPPTLERIVLRALAKRPADRYQSASEMARDLDRFLNECSERVSDRHIAQFIQSVYVPSGRVQDGNNPRARDFRDEGPAPDDYDQPLNFDRVSTGNSVAHALRDSNVFDLAARAVSAPRQPAPWPAPAQTPSAAAPAPPPPAETAPAPVEEPRSRGGFAVGILLIVTALVLSGLFFVLKGP